MLTSTADLYAALYQYILSLHCKRQLGRRDRGVKSVLYTANVTLAKSIQNQSLPINLYRGS